MHKETIIPNLLDFIKNNKIIVIIASLAILTLSATAISNHSLPFSTSNEITYQDPENSSCYITFNHDEHSFYIKDTNGKTYSGVYTETSEAYILNNGLGQTIGKQGNNIITPKGTIWYRK